MFGQEELAELELRKRTLVIESEMNRLALRTEWQHMCDATGWMNHVAGFWRQANPWLVLLAPIAGLLTARTLHTEGGVIGRVLGLLKWVRPLMTAWRRFMGTTTQQRPPKPTGS